MQLRPYQSAAVESIFDYWMKGGGNPLVDLATGTGKSMVIATLTRRLIEQYPEMNVLMLVHVRELVVQNAQALIRAWPGAPIGDETRMIIANMVAIAKLRQWPDAGEEIQKEAAA